MKITDIRLLLANASNKTERIDDCRRYGTDAEEPLYRPIRLNHIEVINEELYGINCLFGM